MLMAVALSQCTGVFGWEWPRLVKILPKNYAVLTIMEESAQLSFRC
jgi:hypothetical protein